MVQPVHSHDPIFRSQIHLSHVIIALFSDDIDGVENIKPAPLPTVNHVVVRKDFIIFPLLSI